MCSTKITEVVLSSCFSFLAPFSLHPSEISWSTGTPILRPLGVFPFCYHPSGTISSSSLWPCGTFSSPNLCPSGRNTQPQPHFWCFVQCFCNACGMNIALIECIFLEIVMKYSCAPLTTHSPCIPLGHTHVYLIDLYGHEQTVRLSITLLPT